MDPANDDLRDEVTCPVCLEIPRSGGLLPCPNSHLICVDCFDRLRRRKVCPECRAAYVVPQGMTKPRPSPLADKLLDQMTFQCRNKEHGCNRKCRRVELSDHEGSCKHQPVPCFDPTCHHMLSIHGLVKHAREKHKENVELDMVTPQVTIQYKMLPDIQSGNHVFSGSTLLTLEGRQFLTIMGREEDTFRAFVLFLGDGDDEAARFSASVALLDRGNATYHMMFHGPVCNAARCLGDLGSNFSGLVFSSKQVRLCCDGGGNLTVHYRVSGERRTNTMARGIDVFAKAAVSPGVEVDAIAAQARAVRELFGSLNMEDNEPVRSPVPLPRRLRSMRRNRSGY